MTIKKHNPVTTQRNNKGKLCASIVLIYFCILAVFCITICPGTAGSGIYLDSAHGNSAYGVGRSSMLSEGYGKGNCVHCHEQHASVGGSEPPPAGGPEMYGLFSANHVSQADNVCLKCHSDPGSLQTGGLLNRSYSYRAGGYLADPLNDVQEAFSFSSPATAHNLGNIRTFINGKWGYTSNSNPCAACHNPHAVKGDPANSPYNRKTSGTRGYSPVSRPSQHSFDNNAWGLWGDAPAERMNTYASSLGGLYQAPIAASGYEPDGSSVQDGSNLTDFNSLCIDCHNNSNIIYSNVLLRNLCAFSYANEMHGGYAASYCAVGATSLLSAPYDGLTQCGKYVLACTDCHEPHGAPNNFLVRKYVNNGIVTVTNNGSGAGPDGRANKEWVYLCGRCHSGLLSDGFHTHPSGGPHAISCITCHPGGSYRNCRECHFHGNSKINGSPYGKPLF